MRHMFVVRSDSKWRMARLTVQCVNTGNHADMKQVRHITDSHLSYSRCSPVTSTQSTPAAGEYFQYTWSALSLKRRLTVVNITALSSLKPIVQVDLLQRHLKIVKIKKNSVFSPKLFLCYTLTLHQSLYKRSGMRVKELRHGHIT